MTLAWRINPSSHNNQEIGIKISSKLKALDLGEMAA
jgi:hypothetical protein